MSKTTRVIVDHAAGLTEFVTCLETGDVGVSLGERNLYLLVGMASRGVHDEDVPRVEEWTDRWCDENDERHPEGWILITHGDADYGHFSIETVATRIAYRGVPVVFIQSQFGEIPKVGSKYWPNYACMGLFGDGKLGYVDGKMVQVWGGYVRNEMLGTAFATTETLAYPDEAMTTPCREGDRSLADSLGGILAVGGGQITREQCELYRFLVSGRPGDLLISCNDLKGEASILNWLYKGEIRTK
jgi:hypothetical protein